MRPPPTPHTNEAATTQKQYCKYAAQGTPARASQCRIACAQTSHHITQAPDPREHVDFFSPVCPHPMGRLPVVGGADPARIHACEQGSCCQMLAHCICRDWSERGCLNHRTRRPTQTRDAIRLRQHTRTCTIGTAVLTANNEAPLRPRTNGCLLYTSPSPRDRG